MGLRRTPDQVKETDRVVSRRLPKGKRAKDDSLAKINVALAKKRLPILKSQKALNNLRKRLRKRAEKGSSPSLKALVRKLGGAAQAIASYYLARLLVGRVGTLTNRDVHFAQPGKLSKTAWLRFLNTRIVSGLVLQGEIPRVEAGKAMFREGEGSRPPVQQLWSIASGPWMVGQCASEAVGASHFPSKMGPFVNGSSMAGENSETGSISDKPGLWLGYQT